MATPAKKAPAKKKSAVKKVEKPAAGTPGTSSPAKPVEKMHVAVLMERKHGFLFRHSHYHINILEVDADSKLSDIEKAARKAAQMTKKMAKIDIRLLDVQKVDIANEEFIAKKVAELGLTTK